MHQGAGIVDTQIRARRAKLGIAIAAMLLVSASAYSIITMTLTGSGSASFGVTATPSSYFEYRWSSQMGHTVFNPPLSNISQTTGICITVGSDSVLARGFNSSHVLVDSGTSSTYMCVSS